MEDEIRNFVESHDWDYVPIKPVESIERIHGFMIHHRDFEPVTGVEHAYLGWYHDVIGLDKAKAEESYLRAVELGNLEAMDNLAIIYSKTGRVDEAVKLWEKGADAGSSYCMNSLGKLAFNNKDYETAEKWYERASLKGNVNSQHLLGIMYLEKGDPREALSRFMVNPKLSKSWILELFKRHPDFLVETLTEKRELQERVRKLEGKVKHYKYSPGSIGFLKVKEHFEELQH